MTFNVNNQYLNNRYISNSGFSNNNALYAWGNNSIGQLGLGDTTNRSSPVQVGAVNYWTRISCGYNYFSLGIQSPGTLWSWGGNSYGQLGVNTSGTNNTYSPVQIPFPVYQGWNQLSASNANFTLGIQSDGTLWSWGNNSYGQLGTGVVRTANFSSPVQVGTLNNWVVVSASSGTTIAFAVGIQNNGTLWAWGNNGYGQLGLNTASASVSSPTQVGISNSWAQISCGYNHWHGIQSNGTLWACGYNVAGCLGVNSNSGMFSTPVQVGSSLWKTISAGYNSSMGIQTNGTLWGWGSSGGGLVLGLNTGSSFPISPVQVGLLSSWTQINFSSSGVLALQNNGTLWTWGINGYGQLGQGNTTDKSSPVQIGALTTWAQVAGGATASALQSNGTLWAWGYNAYGQLGNSNTTNYSSPLQIGTLTNWIQTIPGNNRIGAINNNNSLYTWGLNSWGVLGTNDQNNRSAPTLLLGPLISLYPVSNWTQVAAGNSHWLAIQSNGTLWSCGYNNNGQLGNNSTTTYSSPIQIGAVNIWTQTAAGNFSSYALQQPGTLWAWGFNNYGQLGLNTASASVSSPAQVGLLSNWTQISVNSTSAHALALQSNGTLWAWGYNAYGQLGNSNTTNYSSPLQIGALTVWTQIAAGGYSGYAIQSNGTLWAWGLNSQGQLGLNTTVGVSSPIQIGTSSNWTQIGAGALQLAAIQNNGTLWMCGYNAQGQLGNNSTTNISSLVQVGSLNKWNSATGARQVLAQQIP
jgi:alpha-tubulin suppressor-like RCC1 family protein